MTDRSAEIALTNHLVDRLESMSSYQTDAIQVWQQSNHLDTFNGHIVLTAPRPSGGLVMMIGKFVNDGLAAAVGVTNVGEVFYGMVEKGFNLSDILDELNKKLLFLLPEQMYLSACLIELEQEAKILYVWNGGMPDIVVADGLHNFKYRIPSSNYPLGLKPELNVQPVFFEVADGDTVYGYAETRLLGGEERVLSYKNTAVEQLFAEIGSPDFTVSNLSASADELTLVKFMISEFNHLDADTTNVEQLQPLPPSNWQMSFDFQASTLRHIEIVPLMINALMHMQAPHQHKQRIYTVVTELCSNALDHGVLGLSSELKKTPNGFAEYYMLRGHRLAELDNGYIKVSFSHQAISTGGKLTIVVEDSGDGFDYHSSALKQSDQHTFSGRGLSLLNQLCNKVRFLGKGNQVSVEYLWS